jgi:uncharacterized membrane protein YjgN (DUF898 family)
LSSHATPVDPNAVRAAYSPYVPPSAEVLPRSSNAVAILVLGILSLVVCAVMGPIAWYMGHGELARINAGLVSREDHGMVNAGYICGIIGSILMLITVVFVIFFVVALPMGM